MYLGNFLPKRKAALRSVSCGVLCSFDCTMVCPGLQGLVKLTYFRSMVSKLLSLPVHKERAELSLFGEMQLLYICHLCYCNFYAQRAQNRLLFDLITDC